MSTAPPSVLHLLATDERRGAESFGVLLSGELEQRGWRSEVRAVRSSGTAGVHAVASLGSSWRDVRGQLAFRRIAQEYDVVLAHGSTTLWTAALGSGQGRTPFVYVNIGDPLFWSSTRRRRVRVASLLRRADRVAAISPQAAIALAQHLRVPVDRLEVIPNGRSAALFRPASPERKRASRQRLRLPQDQPVVAFLGALSHEKRPELAVQSIHLLEDVHLVVAGQGPMRAELERESERRAPGRVHFLGSVERPEEVLAAADVVVLTSRTEGLPGVLIEAGLSGLPCVTTDVGYTTDVVLNGQTGRVVHEPCSRQLAAALREALERSEDWGRAARTHCEATYGLEHVVSAWQQLITDVAQRRALAR